MNREKYSGTFGGYQLRNQFSELKQDVNSRGGALDQSLLYLDYESAERWEDLCKELSVFSSFPSHLSDWLTDTILGHLVDNSLLNQEAVSVVALGPGDGKNETQLLTHLLNKKVFQNTSLHLIDISHYLLSIAYEEASVRLGRKGVLIQAHEGNFYDLHHMEDVFPGRVLGAQKQPRTLRVGTMFGNTFGNLTNELNFVQDSLSAFESGDLFIVDVSLIYAPASNEALVREQDPRFSAYPGQVMWENWITGPIFRYRKDVRPPVRVEPVFDTSGPVAGSYTVAVRAVINEEPTFTLVRIRRYDEAKLVEAFVTLGWRSLGGKHVGDGLKKRIVLVFEKQ